MEHFNNKLFRMDLSIMPADIISVIGKHLLIGNMIISNLIKYLEKRMIINY